MQNYIDNTGVQVADVVVGFLHLERKSEHEVARLAEDPSVRFDFYCWDLYASVTRFYEDDASRLELRSRTLQEIEEGEHEAARVAEMVSIAIVCCHLATMLRLNVSYDLLPRESEILHLQFWEKAFELLREKGAIYLEAEGKNKGCWVMRQPGAETSDGDDAEAEQARDPEDNKVIVRSNGTVTYVGKDIAYQLWKFGLLGKDFHYRPFHTYPNAHALWVSSTQAAGGQAPAFGRGQRVYNVIDVRQSYLQNIVEQGLRALGYEEQADRSIHFAYEMVALSPRCCAEMGIELSPEDRKRPYVEISGRKGLGIKADDLVDRLIAEALREVEARHPDEPDEVRRRIATQIAIGALRYFLLKYTCNAVIAFDFPGGAELRGGDRPLCAVRGGARPQHLPEAPSRRRQLRSVCGHPRRAAAVPRATGWRPLLATAAPGLPMGSRRRAGHHHHRAGCCGQVRLSTGSSLQQLLPPLPHLDRAGRRAESVSLVLVRMVDSHLTATLDLLGIEVPEAM